MPQFCANLTLMFNEVPFPERFAAAAKAGFKGVEYLFPYDFPKEQLADLLAQHKLRQVLHNMPGFYLNYTQQALDIIRDTGVDNLYVEYDIYHMQIMEGDLAPTIEKHLAMIPHMQLADTPGRHEPGTVEINYPFLFDCIDKLGYQGWIGCEYKPLTTTGAGLDWIKPYL